MEWRLLAAVQFHWFWPERTSAIGNSWRSRLGLRNRVSKTPANRPKAAVCL